MTKTLLLRHAHTLVTMDGTRREIADGAVFSRGGVIEAVDVIFTDVQKHDWATGGQLWSDKAPPAPQP